MTKKVDKDELGEKLEKLACQIADNLIADKEPAKALTDGFGKLSNYYAQTRKLNLKTPEAEDEGDTFSAIRDKIHNPKIATN